MNLKDPEQKKQIKERILQVLFWLSFLPYVYLLLKASYHAAFGYALSTWIKNAHIRTIYGWEAFETVLFWHGLGLTLLPVLPSCLIYQLFYLIRKSNKKSSSG